jgi:hypothetical protein
VEMTSAAVQAGPPLCKVRCSCRRAELLFSSCTVCRVQVQVAYCKSEKFQRLEHSGFASAAASFTTTTKALLVQDVVETPSAVEALREELAEASSAREVLAFALAHLLHTRAEAPCPSQPASPALSGPETEALRRRIRHIAEHERSLDPEVRAAFVRESVAIANTILRQAPYRRSAAADAATPGAESTADSARLDSAMLRFRECSSTAPPAASSAGRVGSAPVAKLPAQPLQSRDDSARSPLSAVASVTASAANLMVTPSFPGAASTHGSAVSAAAEVAAPQAQMRSVHQTLHDQLAAQLLESPDSTGPAHQASFKAWGAEHAIARVARPQLEPPHSTPAPGPRRLDPCLSPPTPSAAAAAAPFSDRVGKSVATAALHTPRDQADSVNPLFVASPRPSGHNSATNPVYAISPVHLRAPSGHVASPPVVKLAPPSYRSLHQHQVQMHQRHAGRHDWLNASLQRNGESTYRTLQHKRMQEIRRHGPAVAGTGAAPAMEARP